MCTVLNSNDLYLEKDKELLSNNSISTRVVSGDWVTNSYTQDGTASTITTYNYGLNYKISATGSRKVEKSYKQYTNTYYYRIGFNALKRSTSEI